MGGGGYPHPGTARSLSCFRCKPTNQTDLRSKILAQRKALVRIVLNIVAALLILTGSIWILQGINILPGSFMTGQSQWALAGIAVLFAAGLLLYVNNQLIGRYKDQQ